jgi:hypothetical protein
MPYVQRDGAGEIIGLYANRHPGFASEFVADDDADVQAFLHPPPPPVYVSRLTVVDRLIAAGKLADALAALASDPVIEARWNAATEIATDDPTARALLAAVGADPDVILAP